VPAHALWCAVKHDSQLHHNIICLTRDGSRFYVMTLTFDIMTFNVCTASAVTWPNHVPNFRKIEKSLAEFTVSILQAGLSTDQLAGRRALFKTPWPNLNFSCLRHSLLGASTRAISTCRQPHKTLFWAITVSVAISKFKNRSRDLALWPRIVFVASTLRRKHAHQIWSL